MKRFIILLSLLFAAFAGLGITTCSTVVAKDNYAVNWKALWVASKPADMQAYFDQAKFLIEQFDHEHGYSAPRHWHFVPAGQSITVCGHKKPTSSDDLSQYCATDDTIYIGGGMLWEAGQFNWLMGAVLMAHESGHVRQADHGVNEQNVTDGPRGTSVMQEDQADCWAGVWTAWVQPIAGLSRSDIADLSTGFAKAGDDPGEDQTHGIAPERRALFMQGLGGGAKTHDGTVCDDVGVTPVS